MGGSGTGEERVGSGFGVDLTWGFEKVLVLATGFCKRILLLVFSTGNSIRKGINHARLVWRGILQMPSDVSSTPCSTSVSSLFHTPLPPLSLGLLHNLRMLVDVEILPHLKQTS